MGLVGKQDAFLEIADAGATSWAKGMARILRRTAPGACRLTEAIRSLVREVKLLFIAVASAFSFRTTSPFFRWLLIWTHMHF